MMWIFILIAALCSFGCTITITPIRDSPKRKPKHHQSIKPRRIPKNNSSIVDSEWLVQYRKLEQEHGNYTISDDDKVEPAGNGYYKVTPAMLGHFRDLTQVPP